MPRRFSSLLIAVALGLPVSLLLGNGAGVVPGKFMIPPNLNTGFPGCGGGPANCHNSFPNFNVNLEILSVASVRKGSGMVPVTVKVSGANSAVNRGGFSIETTAGAFKERMSTNVRTDTTTQGRSAATHTTSLTRQWTFDWTPPAATGLVEFFATSNAANGDGQNSGDAWGWYGPDASIPGTPYRVFVNDDAVFPFGTSCDGKKAQFSTFKFQPVLGIAKNAAVGQTFQSEVYNVSPGTASIGIFGLSNTRWGPFQLPLDLTPFGAAGCFLRVSMDILQPGLTTGNGNGSGTVQHTWLIPNIPGLRGLDVYFQEMTVDVGANGMNLVFSMGLRANIQ